MTESLLALRIAPAYLTDEQLYDALSAAPVYEAQVARAIKRTIRTIHGLDDLHEYAVREELEIYLGRATESSVGRRFRSHNTKRGHAYGVVLFKTDVERVEALELVAIKILHRLKRRGKLCVAKANMADHPAGAPPRRGEHAVVYMTWRVGGEGGDTDRPKTVDVREIAREVAIVVHGVSRVQIETGLDVVRAPETQKERLRWVRA